MIPGSEIQEPVVRLDGVTHRYSATAALQDVTLAIPAGIMAGFIGPDGVGKSTLLALIAGAKRIQAGTVHVLGGDMALARHRSDVCSRIAYMPQGLGRNLYPDLSVRENLEFFGRLFGQAAPERERRLANLLGSTGMAPFEGRPAKKLSGGMRQKLGLCCALIHDPDLLILDEPTTGVDPLSRRQFWELIAQIRSGRPQMSVLVATAYMEEAEAFDWLVAMDAGKVLATGAPAEIMARTDTKTLEEAFIALLPEIRRAGHHTLIIPPRVKTSGGPIIVAKELTRRFGDFKAVDHASFTIEPGEIFGFLGSNGCGKTTTMKMLTGLLPATSGEALLFGKPVDATDVNARMQVGYMSQSFSLYSELTVQQNLNLHAHLFNLPTAKAQARLAELTANFGLGPYLHDLAASLPLGIRQRLSLAVAIIHEPEMLILDEPTSGVDPLARDAFWEQLIALSRGHGVTIFISTHFMNEAARCDRVALMDAGKVLAVDTPAGLVEKRHAANLEDAFVGFLEEAAAARHAPEMASPAPETKNAATASIAEAPGSQSRAQGSRWFSPQRALAYSIRESLELRRDPIRMGFALFGTAFLMLVLGFGISTDVTHLAFAVLDHDQSFESRAYLRELRGSPYFIEMPPVTDYGEANADLESGTVEAVIEIPPGFGRNLEKGVPVEIGAWIDGAMPFRAETIRGYLLGVHEQFLANWAKANATTSSAPLPATISLRFLYNQSFDSVFAMVPSVLAMMLAIIPAILMALAVVREKELGSITNLYVTPVTRLEFLLGKQVPYVVIAMGNFAIMFAMALLVFQVPLKGSFPTLALGALIYVTATTGYGMLISTFTSTQIAALFGTVILTVIPATQFSGMLAPVSSLSGVQAMIGQGFPMTYFLRISVGTFTKALGFIELAPNLLFLAVFAPVFMALSLLMLRNQER